MSTSKNPQTEIASIFTLIIASIGLMDSFYLTYEHFSNRIPPCSLSIFNDCGRVLTSPYASIFGVPVALIGAIHYTLLCVLLYLTFYFSKPVLKRLVFLSTSVGVVASLYFVGLQLFVIKSFCLFCMISATISFTLYLLARFVFADEYRALIPLKVKVLYSLIGKPLFFILDPEFVHGSAMHVGQFMGHVPFMRSIMRYVFHYSHPSLSQKVAGITFENPLGLAAGYDYTASFPHILPSMGFGFETIGTITNEPCEGNNKPRLGRLVKSKSLLVNKGFRNPGAHAVIQKLNSQRFQFPLGISIGTTNSYDIKTVEDAIQDIVSSFQKFELSKVHASYYELNISCPNLKTKVSFYEITTLSTLLKAIKKLNLKKPLFIKMPINNSDREVKEMLQTILGFPVSGVIFGNLQKDRNDASFVQEEVAKWNKGNFSGLPTQKRSDELIKLAYREVGKKLIIIGCGGVFSAGDAYRKIKNGATLVQMITGMIFEGPQLMGQINRELVELLKKDGYKNIKEAIGTDTHS